MDPALIDRTLAVSVIIPAIDEEASIGLVLADLFTAGEYADEHGWQLAEVIVADNGSRDATARVASDGGARVIHEPRRGYGSACLAGIAALDVNSDIVVFVDGDYSDHPEDIDALVAPIVANHADLVIGSRMARAEAGALLPQAAFGNRLAVLLIRLLFGFRYTDLGPFRAIRKRALHRVGMIDTNFGWTVEMQVKAIRRGLRIEEVPVGYRKRVGRSKITGTLSGTIKAGYKILYTIFKYGFGGSAR